MTAAEARTWGLEWLGAVEARLPIGTSIELARLGVLQIDSRTRLGADEPIRSMVARLTTDATLAGAPSAEIPALPPLWLAGTLRASRTAPPVPATLVVAVIIHARSFLDYGFDTAPVEPAELAAEIDGWRERLKDKAFVALFSPTGWASGCQSFACPAQVHLLCASRRPDGRYDFLHLGRIAPAPDTLEALFDPEDESNKVRRCVVDIRHTGRFESGSPIRADEVAARQGVSRALVLKAFAALCQTEGRYTVTEVPPYGTVLIRRMLNATGGGQPC